MKINNEEININDLVDNKYMHKEIKKGIFLSDYQNLVREPLAASGAYSVMQKPLSLRETINTVLERPT